MSHEYLHTVVKCWSELKVDIRLFHCKTAVCIFKKVAEVNAEFTLLMLLHVVPSQNTKEAYRGSI